MIYKEIINNELYVYMNGSLLYKRWLDKGHGIVLCRTPFRAIDIETFTKSI